VEIPGLGSLSEDDIEGYRTDTPVRVPALDGEYHVSLAGYDDDPDPAETHAVIAAFLSLGRPVLLDAAPAIYDYYRTVASDLRRAGVEPVAIDGPGDVWDHITPTEVTVERDGPEGDGPVYVSIECECAWEPEHGLLIVLRDGTAVTRAGPQDGHLR
jgi:hypothetical protein